VNPDPAQVLVLRDIHLPAAPSVWPPAPGWWLVGGALLVALAWLAVRGLNALRLRRRRQQWLAAVVSLESEILRGGTPDALSQLSVLLRRIALARFPREEVAALTGRAWLEFLDASGGGGRFAHGPGQVLEAGPYRRAVPADLDGAALMALVRAWVLRNAGV
jgi:hypothetical protein